MVTTTTWLSSISLFSFKMKAGMEEKVAWALYTDTGWMFEHAGKGRQNCINFWQLFRFADRLSPALMHNALSDSDPLLGCTFEFYWIFWWYLHMHCLNLMSSPFELINSKQRILFELQWGSHLGETWNWRLHISDRTKIMIKGEVRRFFFVRSKFLLALN